MPQSIIINEMLPKLRSDPSYLDRLGYQVEIGGRAVSSSSVNWNGSTADVAVRQPPSSDNALGRIEDPVPEQRMRSTCTTRRRRASSSATMRALSHGCVRLADPRRDGSGRARHERRRCGNADRSWPATRRSQVPQKIPVYVAYFTAWPNKDGVVEYFDDVYDRDAYVR